MESPLDVLSRAATMLQESQPDPEDVEGKLLGGKSASDGSTKWKRDRKYRLPAYSRKSDIKTKDDTALIKEEQLSTSPPDSPIDMSVRQRGQPPSYTQTINNPNYRSSTNRTTSVITSATTPNFPQPPVPITVNNRDLPSGISMCDPIIDEHFRRSLGKDYMTIFSSNNNISSNESATNLTATKSKTSTSPIRVCSPVVLSSNIVTNNLTDNSSVKELMDSSGLSVDDHFAKALGDTWLKLNQKNGTSEIKNEPPPPPPSHPQQESVVSS